MADNTSKHGLEASFAELVRSRQVGTATGFAPSGRVKTHQMGANLSVFHGRGMEFDESRPYQPGDDVRTIDWRLTARTGAMHTKLFHEERERPVQLLVDLRPNMQFGTRKQFKSVLAANIAAKLAWTAIDGGDRVGGLLLAPSGVKTHQARRSQALMLTFLKTIAQATQLEQTEPTDLSLSNAVDRLRRICRPGTLVFIISDFADLDERTARSIRRLSLHTHVTNIQVYDPLEESLPIQGDCRLSDGKQVLALDSLGANAQQEHHDRFAQRMQDLQTLSRRRGMAYHAVTTAEDADAVLWPRRTGKVAHPSAQRMSA